MDIIKIQHVSSHHQMHAKTLIRMHENQNPISLVKSLKCYYHAHQHAWKIKSKSRESRQVLARESIPELKNSQTQLNIFSGDQRWFFSCPVRESSSAPPGPLYVGSVLALFRHYARDRPSFARRLARLSCKHAGNAPGLHDQLDHRTQEYRFRE